MDPKYIKGLRANIWKQYMFSALMKRPYLSLIAIYAVSIAHLSLYELGVVVSISSIISLALEVPSGYLADKFGHKRSLIIANFFVMLAPLFFAFMPDFLGMVLGVGFFFGGVAFYSGVRQAFMHETLLELGEDSRYNRVESLNTRIGLLGNMVLVALVPLSYAYDVRWPFLIAFVLNLFTFFLSFTLVTPIKTKQNVQELEHVSFPNLLRNLRRNGMLLLFFLLGIVATMYDKLPTFRELYFTSLGIPPQYLGFILAGGSLLGALFSLYIPKLSKWKEDRFYLFDILLSLTLTILIGFSTNIVLAIVWFTFLTAYDRNRDTVIHNFMLMRSPTRELKATYISLLNFSGEIQGIWMPLFLGYLVGKIGLNPGYLVFGIIFVIPMLLLYGIYRHRKALAAAEKASML